MKSEFGTAAFVVSAGLILKLGIATTALVGSILLINRQLDVLTFFMFLLVVSRLYDPMQSTLQNLAAIISTSTNVARMNEILDHDVQTGNTKLTNKGYDVEFKNVEFSYNNNENVLKDVSFTAKQGEVTALIGPSGGGKTTVSRLAARFWDINHGKITVGGMDISKIEPETLLSLYSIVFQDVILFNNTITENIRLGKRTQQMKKFSLPQNLQTVMNLFQNFPTVTIRILEKMVVSFQAVKDSVFQLHEHFLKTLRLFFLTRLQRRLM